MFINGLDTIRRILRRTFAINFVIRIIFVLRIIRVIEIIITVRFVNMIQRLVIAIIRGMSDTVVDVI